MTKVQPTWAYEYLPYTAQDGHEIPCFRIYPEDEPDDYIAETNEHLPFDIQEAYARQITASSLMFAALKFALPYMEDLAGSSDNKGERRAAKLMRAAIARAQRGAP